MLKVEEVRSALEGKLLERGELRGVMSEGARVLEAQTLQREKLEREIATSKRRLFDLEVLPGIHRDVTMTVRWFREVVGVETPSSGSPSGLGGLPGEAETTP